MIYIVEVLERMLILAASRLSMIALEEKTERSGAYTDTEGAYMKERKEKSKTYTSHQLFINYTGTLSPSLWCSSSELQENTLINSEIDSKLCFLPQLS